MNFRCIKKDFPWVKMLAYKFFVQRDIAIACMTVHNFLRLVSLSDRLFLQDEEEDYSPNVSDEKIMNLKTKNHHNPR